MKSSPITTAGTIRIVEYDHSYAAALADMWNKSNESWGGGSSQRTAESIRQDMDSTINLHVFLAVDGEEVVGFCSFSHYMLDEGALYVPLLNVRPDYHNKKVGKTLILNAVAKTVELGWPRLDLFTWAGNTKAVPMYKKCGFFWEKKDDGVHLMNYIPTVLQTDALQPYLEGLDWYGDSTRSIEIKPDGESRGGKFDIFRYSWAKDGQELQVEFEKTGRGIWAIDTPDYEIRTEIAEHDLVFGRAYPVRYHIRSKTGQPVVCEITGSDSKNIRFPFNHKITVTDTVTVEAEFWVDPVPEEQSSWKTHPVVLSQWTINGRKAELRAGIAPLFPAKLSLAGQELEHYIGARESLFVNVENMLPEEAEIRFTLPEADFIRFESPEVAVRVPAKGKASVEVPYVLNGFGLYTAVLSVQAVTGTGTGQDMVTAAKIGGANSRVEAGTSVHVQSDFGTSTQAPITFEHTISLLLRGYTGHFAGQDRKHAYAACGPNVLILNKEKNELYFRRTHMGSSIFWGYPRIGKPYSSEFSQKQAEQVRLDQDGDAQLLETFYLSGDHPGIAVKSMAKVWESGLVERYYVVENRSDAPADTGLKLLDCFRMELKNSVLPYDGVFLELNEAPAQHMEQWEPQRLSENWIFTRNEKLTYGIFWDESLQLSKADWMLGLEHSLGALPPGGSVRTASVWVAVGMFADWHDLRSYVRRERPEELPVLTSHMELSANNGNPFTGGSYQLEVTERKLTPLAGKLRLELTGREASAASNGSDGSLTADSRPTAPGNGHNSSRFTDGLTLTELELAAEDHCHTARFDRLYTASARSSGRADRLRLVYEGEVTRLERRSAVFPVSQGMVAQERLHGEAGELLRLDNGLLSLSVSPAFGSAAHSLIYGGREWLHSSFPTPGPRSWWNPWLGGMGIEVQGMSHLSLQQEARSAAFVRMEDTCGNRWSGIRLTVSIEQHEHNRGLSVDQYYLMLPGAPVLAKVNRIVNRTGQGFPKFHVEDCSFLLPGGPFDTGWSENDSGLPYRLGSNEAEWKVSGLGFLGSVEHDDLLHTAFGQEGTGGYTYYNNKIFIQGVSHNLFLRHDEEKWTKPVFYILGDERLVPDELRALVQLRFVPGSKEEE